MVTEQATGPAKADLGAVTGTSARHSRRRPWPGPNDAFFLPLVFVAGCLVTVARSPQTLIHPQFWAEDGSIYYHQAVADAPPLAPVFHPYAGYLQVLPRLGAELARLVSLRDAPATFALVALGVQVLPAVFLASKRMAGVIPDLRVRLVFAAGYLVVPNSSEINVSLTNMHWHLAVLAVLVVVASTPRGVAGRVVDVAVVSVSALSGPFVFALVVVAWGAVLVWRRRWSVVIASVASACALVQLAYVVTGSRPSVRPLGATPTAFVELIGGRLIGTLVLGTRLATGSYYYRHLLVLSIALFGIGALVVGIAMWRGPWELRLFNLWAAILMGLELASPLATARGHEWPALIHEPGNRYWYFATLALLADVLWAAGRALSGRVWLAVPTLALVVVVVGLGIRGDLAYPMINAPSWQAQVTRYEASPPGHPFVFELRPPGWTMTLVRR